MRRLILLFAMLFALSVVFGGTAYADGPSGSTECHVNDDDCDGIIDEDPVGDANGDGNADDDGDGKVDEDPPGDATDTGENQVDCNEETSQDVGGVFYLFVGESGVESCADEGSSLPVDGRAILSGDGYAAIDGDADNPGQSTGYARLDGGGLHCGDETNQDSTADQSGNTAEDCG